LTHSAPAAEPTTVRRAVLLLAAGVAVSQLLALLVGQPGLGTDEAHYALYGLHLDWSYFDHPPLVGWLQALAMCVSEGEFALRAWPVLSLFLSGLLVARLTSRLFPHDSPWTSFWAMVLLYSSPMLQLIGISMLPEAPLLPLGLWTLLVLLRLRERPKLKTWLQLGLCLGLAGLAKYTAVTLVVTAGIVLWIRRPQRLFAGLGPVLAVVLAALIVSPVFVWNAQHDWASFSYQFSHGTGGGGWELGRALAGQAGQLLAFTPCLYLLGWTSVLAARHELAHDGVRCSLALALPILILFGFGSGFETSLPHWTSLAWVGLAPLTARRLVGSWKRRRVRVLAFSSAVYSVLLLFVIYSQIAFWWIPFSDYHDPSAALRGWPAAAQTARRLQSEMADEAGPAPRLFVDSWARASRLAWYARPEPVLPLDNSPSQFDLWYGLPEEGDRGILIVWDRKGDDDEVGDLGLFADHHLITEQHVDVAGHRAATFRFFACSGYGEQEL